MKYKGVSCNTLEYNLPHTRIKFETYKGITTDNGVTYALQKFILWHNGAIFDIQWGNLWHYLLSPCYVSWHIGQGQVKFATCKTVICDIQGNNMWHTREKFVT